MALTRFLTVVLLSSVPLSWAHPLAAEHAEQRRGGLQGGWFQPADHPVHNLFRRQNATANSTAVGSAQWAAQYPPANPDSTKMPQAWIDALNKAQAAGLIPNISMSTNEGETYPAGVNATSPQVCSSTQQCRAPGDIWDAPDGMIGISFDDGPTEFSNTLYQFLKANQIIATHFMIGENILNSPQLVQQAFGQGDHIACHTWSHRYMTGLSSMDVVAEFGYTLQIISDLTGGRITRFWRPPYGDSDNRVRAIAKEIFGLIQVDWNQDTNDWNIGLDNITPQSVAANLQTWLTGPKSPGLIILEHELTNDTVSAFINTAWPLIKANGWDHRAIPDLFNEPWYANAQNDQGAVVAPLNVINAASSINLAPTSAPPPTQAQAGPTGTAAGAAAASASHSSTTTKTNDATSLLPSPLQAIISLVLPLFMLL
ncbi:hypothetical protein FRB99_000818 [Tulasnella sp. 403]|nr:hypothetical protein FRB99_000818 [Tulasnella sp. 403]